MNNSDIALIAKDLREANASCKAIAPVNSRLAENDIAAAYAVQKANTDFWLNSGKQIAGYKIGLTNPAVQQQLGVDQPDFGVLFSDMAVCDGQEIAANRLIQPKVEAEVAFVLGRDINSEHITVADIIRSVEYVLPAIEIVDSRIANWKISILDTIADNASSGLFVLGNEPKLLTNLDLRMAGMAMTCRGEIVSVGAGVACLGHPINAAQWLAQKLASLNTPLREGDIVLSGALGPMVPVVSGNVYEAKINGLGSVRAAFSEGNLNG